MRTFFLSLIAALLFALPAQAQTIEKLSADRIGVILGSLGLTHVETSDNRGFPLVQVATQGQFRARNINVLFYGCDASGCNDVTLYSWFEPQTRVNTETIHEWNDIFRQSRNWSRAYIDEEGDPTLVMNINAEGGIGTEALQILIYTYLIESEDFGALIGAVGP